MIVIRAELPGDEDAIHSMVERAFVGHPYSDGDEALVIDRLRTDGDLLLSLVAVDGDRIVGQITYSIANLSNGESGWMVLGPVSVDPARHGEGIGRSLIKHGEEAMQEYGAKGITVLGDPALYSRFGFEADTPIRLAGELGPYLQVKSFGSPIPQATITYAPAFSPGG